MMATVPHVTSGLGLRKFHADGFLLTRVYLWNVSVYTRLCSTMFRKTVFLKRFLCCVCRPLDCGIRRTDEPNSNHQIYFFEVHYHTSCPVYALISQVGLLPCGLSTKLLPISLVFLACYHSLFGYPSNIRQTVKILTPFIVYFAQYFVSSSLFGSNILPSTLFSNTPDLLSSLSAVSRSFVRT